MNKTIKHLSNGVWELRKLKELFENPEFDQYIERRVVEMAYDDAMSIIKEKNDEKMSDV